MTRHYGRYCALRDPDKNIPGGTAGEEALRASACRTNPVDIFPAIPKWSLIVHVTRR